MCRTVVGHAKSPGSAGQCSGIGRTLIGKFGGERKQPSLIRSEPFTFCAGRAGDKIHAIYIGGTYGCTSWRWHERWPRFVVPWLASMA